MKTRLFILLTPLVLLAALWWAVVAWTLSDRALEIEGEREALAQLNAAVAENVNGLLRLLEMAMTTTRDWLAEHPGEDPFASPAFRSMAGHLRGIAGGQFDLFLVDRLGDVRSLDDAPGTARANIGDRSLFRECLEAPTAGLRIGAPVKSRVDGRWVVPVTLRADVRDGDVAFVYGMIRLDHFEAVHEPARRKPGGTVVLVRADGVVLGRIPFHEPVLGQSIAGNPLFVQSIGGQDRGFVFADGRLSDGIQRLVSFQRLEAYPLIVTVSSAVDDLLSGWVDNTVLRVALLAVVTAGVCFIVWRLDKAMKLYAAAKRDLETLAATDELTGLANRRSFFTQGAREVERARRASGRLCMLLIDIDYFKAVNDRHGHAAGDRALRRFAEALRAACRAADLCARVGGEEFAVLLADAGEHDALEVALRLCEKVRETDFGGDGQPVRLTASVGVASLDEARQGMDALYQLADQALYDAKNAGRDRVVAAG